MYGSSMIQDYKNYWGVQTELVAGLREIGVTVPLSLRFKLFKLRIDLQNQNLPSDIIGGLLALVDKLVALRIAGVEPEHKKGLYL